MSWCSEVHKEYQPTSLIYEYFLRWDQNNGLQTWFAGGICQCQQNWRGEHHFREKGPSAIYTHVEMDGFHNDVNEYLIHSLPADSCVISTNDNKRQVLSRLSAVHDFSHFDMFYHQLHGLSPKPTIRRYASNPECVKWWPLSRSFCLGYGLQVDLLEWSSLPPLVWCSYTILD